MRPLSRKAFGETDRGRIGDIVIATSQHGHSGPCNVVLQSGTSTFQKKKYPDRAAMA
jgi:hypothetical protein